MTDATAPTHLLDTDHLDFLTRRRGPEYQTLRDRLTGDEPVAWAAGVISFQEQVSGAMKLIKGRSADAGTVRGYDLLDAYRRFYGRVPVPPFDSTAAAEFTRLEKDSAARRVGTNDLRIAATASARGLTLPTRNAKDFARVPGLRFEDWTAPAAPADAQ